MKKQAEAYYKGSVQGVGFRFTAERIARNYPIAGFVMNMPDGNVEIVAEGEEEDLKGFLEAVESEMKQSIHGATVNWQAFTGKLHGFEIKFCR